MFLGRLRDLAGAEDLMLPAPLDWETLLASLPVALATEVQGKRVHVACAGRVLADKFALAATEGDEVALLPPVSGG
jgi:molybdopterin synthase sulfur carrier subunit